MTWTWQVTNIFNGNENKSQHVFTSLGDAIAYCYGLYHGIGYIQLVGNVYFIYPVEPQTEYRVWPLAVIEPSSIEVEG